MIGILIGVVLILFAYKLVLKAKKRPDVAGIKEEGTKGTLKKPIIDKDAITSILSSIISIAIGIFVGFIVMLIIALVDKDITVSDAFGGLFILFKGPFASSIKSYVLTNTGDVIFYAVPLIMTGLSVAIAYKTGLFNIGAPGQYIMGTIGCLIVALNIHTSSTGLAVLVWILALIVGAVFGMIWGIIPGLLKAFFNINEVIICIMTNWIAANLATWLFTYTPKLISEENTKGGYLKKTLSTGVITPKLGLDKVFNGSYIDIGIFIAIIIAILIYIILNKTTFGYELKACGHNRNSSKYAGLNEKKNIVASMAIAGALAGIGASLYFLNPGIEYKFTSQYSILPSYGFNGIASAFLANCNPLGTVITSLLIRYLNMGGEYLTRVGYNRYIADIIVAIIIYLAGFTRFFKELLSKKSKTPSNIKRDGPDKEIASTYNDAKNVETIDDSAIELENETLSTNKTPILDEESKDEEVEINE